MEKRCCAAALLAVLLRAAPVTHAEDIPIPDGTTSPAAVPSVSLAAPDAQPASDNTNTTAPAAGGNLAYPSGGETPAPAMKHDGAGMALHPGIGPAPTAPARKRPGLFNSVHTSRKVVALTFDDGPHGKLTPKLLDLLKRENVRATFFVLGSLVAVNPQIVQRMAAEGHEVANHSWDHPRLPALSAEKFNREIRETSDIIEKNTGRKVTLMRPTYGLYNERVRHELTDTHGLDIILWSVDPNDWKKPGPDAVARRLIAGAHPGAILLAHDIHPGTIAAMPKTIAGLKAQGYTFATVSELLAMDEPPAPSPASAAKSTAKAASVPAGGGVKTSSSIPR